LGAAGSSNAAAVAQARAKLALPPKDRQKLLAFAACYCPATDLPALTDDLVAVQHEVAFKDALRQKQRQLQQQGSQQQQQQSQLEYKQPGLMLPLQQPAEAFEQQRQQLLQEAVAAAAGCTSLSKGQLDPYRGLLSFGDPHALLAVLLSSSSPAEAQQLLEDALATQLSNDSSSGSSATASGSYCCLQRLLVGGTAAQLLLLLQPLPQPSLEQVAAASPGIRPLSINLKLPQHQQLLLQVLHAPLAQLQSAARKLQQQQLLPPNGTDVLAAAADLLSRLQQIADGRQLLQWLPGIETGRFFAGECLCCAGGAGIAAVCDTSLTLMMQPLFMCWQGQGTVFQYCCNRLLTNLLHADLFCALLCRPAPAP
jgi:hypothetical protein